MTTGLFCINNSMITFREYLVEYATKQNSQLFGIAKLRSGTNGKLLDDPHNRKHKNAFKKEYSHKHPVIDSICNGKSNNVQIAGQPLLSILSLYGTQFEPGIKTLGNSDVEVEMYEDEEGLQRGILRNRKKNNGL
jgi:hypothetical protein